MNLVKTIYQPWTKRAARRVVVGRPRDRRASDKGRFTRDDVDRLLKAAWRRYDEAAAKLAPQPTIGSRMNVRLACFTKIFLDELLADGVEREYAPPENPIASELIYRLVCSTNGIITRSSFDLTCMRCSIKRDSLQRPKHGWRPEPRCGG